MKNNFNKEIAKINYIIDNIDDGLLILDKTLKITRINRQGEKILAIEDKDKDNFINWLHNNFKIFYQDDLEADLKTKSLKFDIQRRETSNYQSLIFEVNSYIVKENNKIDSILILLTDVTYARQETLVKDTFLNLMPHKLKTPITVIKEVAYLLKNPHTLDSDKTNKLVEMIEKKTDELLSLVNKLLDYTIINTRELGLEKNIIKVGESLNELKIAFSKKKFNKEISINLDCCDAKIIVNMNKDYFELVMNNIWENAVKFNDKDKVEIYVKVNRQGERVIIAITDNGLGIPEELKDKIFDKFYQIDKYTTGNIQGAGLGLALVKRIINSYGGIIEVESEIGKATTFKIIIPVI